MAGAVPGSVVPVWRDGLDNAGPAPDYRRIMEIVTDHGLSGAGAMDCRQLAAGPGLEPVPAKVEGVRSKAKRLAARGRPAKRSPRMFSATGRAGGS